MRSFTNKDGELRIYEGSASSWYIPIRFTGADFSGPLGRNRPEETLILDRQTMNCYYHMIETSDARIVEPVGLSFSCRTYDSKPFGYFIDALAGRTVNGKTFTTTKATTKNDGSNFNPAFLDAAKKTFNVQILWAKTGGNDPLACATASFESFCMKYNEVFFDLGDQTVTEAEDGVTLSLSGLCYGTVISSVNTFTAGNNVASCYDCS